jgi:hypothetical protein
MSQNIHSYRLVVRKCLRIRGALVVGKRLGHDVRFGDHGRYHLAVAGRAVGVDPPLIAGIWRTVAAQFLSDLPVDQVTGENGPAARRVAAAPDGREKAA